MEKAVGALRVLQTFWSNNESEQLQHGHGHRGSAQASPTLQASPDTETPTRRLWHLEPKVKLEEGDEEEEEEKEGSLYSENHWTQAPESREHNDRLTGEPPNLTSQNIDNTTPRASTSPEPSESESEKASSEDSGPSSPGRPDVPYTNLGFAMPPEAEVDARHATSPSPQPSTHGSHDHGETQDSVVVATGTPSQPSAGYPGEQRPGRKGFIAPRADRRVYSDEEIHNQPDIIFADGTLTMPLDGPQLREIIQRIEQDRLLCFKMRWYVARYVRRQYQTDLSPSCQLYRRRMARAHHFSRQPNRPEQLIALRGRPFSRLDFEASRLQENFYRNQPGWQMRHITQILQKAYEQYGWEEAVTEENVDQVLVLQAGADLRAFDAAGRMSRACHGSPISMPAPDVLRAIEDETPLLKILSNGAATTTTIATPRQSRLPPEEQQHFAERISSQGPALPPSTPLPPNVGAGAVASTVTTASPAVVTAARNYDEISQLRAEIRELKAEVERGRQFRESYAEEQRASQEALMAEMRLMLEAAECGRNQNRTRKRKRGSESIENINNDDNDKKKKKQKSKSKSEKRKRKSKSYSKSEKSRKRMRKYVRKLKELDVDDHTTEEEDELSSSSSSTSSSYSAGEDSTSDSE